MKKELCIDLAEIVVQIYNKIDNGEICWVSEERCNDCPIDFKNKMCDQYGVIDGLRLPGKTRKTETPENDAMVNVNNECW